MSVHHLHFVVQVARRSQEYREWLQQGAESVQCLCAVRLALLCLDSGEVDSLCSRYPLKIGRRTHSASTRSGSVDQYTAYGYTGGMEDTRVAQNSGVKTGVVFQRFLSKSTSFHTSQSAESRPDHSS